MRNSDHSSHMSLGYENSRRAINTRLSLNLASSLLLGVVTWRSTTSFSAQMPQYGWLNRTTNLHSNLKCVQCWLGFLTEQSSLFRLWTVKLMQGLVLYTILISKGPSNLSYPRPMHGLSPANNLKLENGRRFWKLLPVSSGIRRRCGRYLQCTKHNATLYRSLFSSW